MSASREINVPEVKENRRGYWDNVVYHFSEAVVAPFYLAVVMNLWFPAIFLALVAPFWVMWAVLGMGRSNE